MEPIKPAAGQKSTKQPREKSMLQRKWGSEPSAGTKRSTFADQELKRHSHRDTIVQSSSGSSTGSYSPGKLQMSTAVGQPPQENQYPQHFPSPYSYQMAHPFSQQSIPQRFLHNTKPQRGPDISAWPFASKLQSTASEDLLSVHSRGHGGVFSRRKSPSLAAAYSQYSQAGMEPAEEMHKKEQKPKKPGKYICHYCGRACAKPSVLKKHIRSHTGERPYPCIPCGFSFKTKSNLYKHRKSHAHAIKAGLVPFSDLATSRSDMDQPSSVGEAEVHSDGEQSTDTDEEIALGSEGSVFLDKSSPVPQISLLSDKKPLEKGSDLTGMDPPGDLAITPMKVPILIVPKSGIQPVNECPPFTETETSKSAALAYRVDDSHTIKQRLALRLNEKKGSDSEPMLNLLSPHSKGSTDSGYFSRSESADQQISPPNTNAKSYEEIIFGKYYRLNPRSAVTGMVSQDSSAVDIKEKPGVLPMIASKFGITKIIDEHISQLMTGPEALGDHRKLNTTKMTIFSDSSDSSHLLTSHDSKQYPAGSCQTNTGLLEALPDSGPLIRSNSMPTQSAPSLSVPQGLRGSHSFDERMTSDDVFYPGTTGVSHRTMLRRQAAFELSSAHEGHVDSDSYSSHSKSIARGKLCELGQVMPEGKMLNVDRSLYECEMCETSCRRWEDFENHKRFSCPELRGSFCAFNLNPSVESYSDYVLQTQLLQQRQATETATRKRRKEKSVGDDEDPPSQYGTEVRAPAEMLVSGDYDPKLKGENFEAATSNMTADDVLLVTDSEKMTENRRAAGNVISVIQHTNSLSRPNSFEKSESIELLSYQDKLVSQHSEQSDSETTEDVQTETTSWAESMERQKTEGRQSALPPNHQQYHMPHRLVRQPNIQVPEIRVTEEPDKPEKELEVPAKEPEKPVEEFQWPQRSETLSQLPAEKLPPKKKRLRLAEIEHSSGESSFESTCTSLSRSPSQESNLSHSSSFSMSFDRDENMKSVSPTKQDELGKPSEFLTVPGSAHSLSIPSQHQQREMRRSSSEQAPCPLPIEIPEIRSKSFDYGSLSPASTQADPYVNSVKERKRCFLVRQASLSVYPETGAQEQSPEQAAKQDHVEQLQVGHYPPYNVWHGSSSSGLQSIPFGDSSKCKRSLQYHGVAEEPQQEGHSSVPKVSYNPGQITPENDGQPHEHSGREVMQYSSFHASSSQSPFPVLPIQQALFWQSHHGSSPRHLQQHLAFQAQHLQKLHIRPPNLSLVHQKGHSSHQLQQIHEQPDAKALESLCDHSFQYVSRASSQNTGHISSQTYTTSGVLLQQVQPVFATQNIGGSQPSLPGMLVPVRIQTHVPSYSSVMYTSVSQIIVSHSQSTSSATVLCKVSDNISQGTFSTSSAMQGIGFNLSHILGHHGGLLRYPLWKVPQPLTSRLEAGIPLCLTSGSITVTDASSSIGGSKRMLSPASSLELFMETKQQKRVKEEKMYGQIVEELSAVELSNSGVTKDHSKYQKPEAGRREGSGALKEGMVSSSSLDFAENKALSPKPVSHPDDSSDNVSLLQKTLVKSSSGRDSPEELEVDEATPETGASPRSFLSASSTQEDLQMQQTSKVPVNMLVHLAANQGGAAVGGTILLTDVADVQQLFQFPSLRTTTSVSWCFLNYTKPNHSQTTPVSSVYASWCISSYNPNPPSLSTKASLALLRSRQRKNTETYTMAAFYRPGSGKLVSSLSWKQKFDQVKPELTQLEVTKFEKKAKPTAAREREKGEHLGEKDISGKPAEPTRIKIFEGGSFMVNTHTGVNGDDLDFASNERLLMESRMRHITCIVRERQLRHYGHVARFPEGDPAHRILIVGDTSGWTRPRGHPHSTWLRQIEGHFRRVGQDRMSAWGVGNRDPELFCYVVGVATLCTCACSPT
ncbi:ZEP2 factor, partial [Polypterus senegalus]